MVEVPEGNHQMDNQKFRIRSFAELSSIADTDSDLFDVIGQLRLINGDNLKRSTTEIIVLPAEGNKQKDRISLHLRMKEGESIRVTLWGDIASSFRNSWNNSAVQPHAVAAPRSWENQIHQCTAPSVTKPIILECLVSDVNEDVATFVLFDREATNLIGRKADSLLDGSDLVEHQTVPQPVKSLIGKTFEFQLRVTSYNFTASR